MEWILLALIALVIILLIKIIRDLKKLHDAGAYGGGTPGTQEGIAALEGALAILSRLKNEDRRPAKAECQQLKDYYEAAQAGHVSTLALEPIRNVISELCPDN